MSDILCDLVNRYPALLVCRNEIADAFEVLRTVFLNGGKLLIAGNGGSAADCEHISGELLKSFLFKRDIKSNVKETLAKYYAADGVTLASKLEGALPVIPLPSFSSLYTAFANDSDPDIAFAQMVYGLGNAGDVLLAISTSGNARNVTNAAMTARAVNMKSIGLTGLDGGKLNRYCDVVIHVPSNETFLVQEYHLPVYHAICAMLEIEFFNSEKTDMT